MTGDGRKAWAAFCEGARCQCHLCAELICSVVSVLRQMAEFVVNIETEILCNFCMNA